MGTLLPRSSPSGALTHRMRCVGRLRKRRSSSEASPRLIHCFGHGRLLVREARSIVRASALGLVVRSSASPASGPPNKSFKPTPCRGAGHVLCATLARVRRPATGRLNSGVRRVDQVIRQFVDLCAADTPASEADVEAACDLAGISRDAFYDDLAWYIANEFAAGRLTFEDGDAAMNWMFGMAQFALPELAFEVFSAFDDGEFERPEVLGGTDPVSLYTRPHIAEIIARGHTSNNSFKPSPHQGGA